MLVGAATLIAAVATPLAPRVGLAAAALPQPAHVVIVMEENRSQANIIGNKSAPFINALAARGANMAQSFAETHPSEPNYLALFAGSTFGVTKDACPVNGGAAPNLASELLAAGYTFVGYRRRPARGRLTGVQRGQVRAQARAVGQLHQRAADELAAVLGISDGQLRQPADRVVRHPQQRQQHARRLDRRGRRLAEPPTVRHTPTGRWPTTAC